MVKSVFELSFVRIYGLEVVRYNMLWQKRQSKEVQKMRGLLVTGFDACHGDPQNPSERLARRLAKKYGDDDVKCVILPTVYSTAPGVLMEAVRAFSPKRILMLGVAAREGGCVHVERQSHNMCGQKMDNEGKVGPNPILEGGQDVCPAPLHDDITGVLRHHQLPFVSSLNAGSFLCNYMMYVCGSGSIPYGFIHVPANTDRVDPCDPDGRVWKSLDVVVGSLIGP